MSPVPYQEPEAVHPLIEVHKQIASLLRHPHAGGVGGDPDQVNPPTPYLDDEQHLQAG
jgi:hypothetical protein